MDRFGELRRLGARPYLVGIALAVSSAVLFVIAEDVPADVWRPRDPTGRTGDLHGWAFVVLALASIVAATSTVAAPVARALARQRRRDAVAAHEAERRSSLRRLEHQDRIRDALPFAFRRIADDDDAPPWHELSVNAYWVADERLLLAASLAFHTRPPTDIEWTPGKGVIGRSWVSGNDEGLNLARPDVARARRDRERWRRLPEEVRMGLSFDDIQKVVGYDAVVAVPATVVVDGRSERVGVLSMNGPAGSFQYLDRRPQRDKLREFARLLEPELHALWEMDALGDTPVLR
ncbi:hypothetical protein [Ilumatobacter sp.]|uniref:hypothetical protein n=1 Tax=Ilumatobacter sp. TaxID=1967498 RepID=UPI003B529D64